MHCSLPRIAILFCVCATNISCQNYESVKNATLARSSEATKTVEAIYAYKDSIGLWPVEVDDLIPTYLDKKDVPSSDWKYLWNGYETERGPMLRMRGALHISLFYEFPAESNKTIVGWQAKMEGDPLRVSIPQNIPKSKNIDSKDIEQRSIEELNCRIESEEDDRIKNLHVEKLKNMPKS